MMVIETERVLLREMTENDFEALYKVYNEKNLTEEDVVKLNLGRDAKEVFAELGEIF